MNLLAGSINHNVYHSRCYRQQVTQPFLNSRYSWSGGEIISPCLTHDLESVAVAKFESLFSQWFLDNTFWLPKKTSFTWAINSLGRSLSLSTLSDCDSLKMPYKYGNAPGLLQETISKITYKSEYTTSFTGERVPLQNVRIPTGLKMRTAWDEARTPETSRAIQLPFHHRRNYPARVNLQGLQPSPTARARSALQRPSSNASQISRSSGRRPTSSVSAFSKRERPSTEDLLRRPQSLVARRPQSELSRFPKEFRYIDKQCFFHPATEPSRSFFIISPDWVSERKNYFIRKNTLFG